MFGYTEDSDIKVALHYEDHPIAANDDFLSLNAGTATLVKLSLEEVKTHEVQSIKKVIENSILLRNEVAYLLSRLCLERKLLDKFPFELHSGHILKYRCFLYLGK